MSNVTTVSLEPHPACKMVHGVKVHLVKDQHQVMVTPPGGKPTRVAYCSVAADGPIQFIQRYPEEFRDFVVAEVNQLRGGDTSRVFQPPELLEIEQDDDTEQEDEE